MSAELKESDTTSAVKTKPSAYFEPVVLVLLSLATVGTAWCSYQAAAWGGVAQRFTNLAMASSRTAAANQLQAQQLGLLDVMLFSQYINARVASNETLARFYTERFRGEAKVAFNSWMETRPFDNPAAPAHPFVTNFYQPRLLTESRQAEAESDRLSQQAGEAGRTSRSYILITVLLACALFCGGTASKFEARWMRKGVLVLGLAAFAFAVERVWLLPTQF